MAAQLVVLLALLATIARAGAECKGNTCCDYKCSDADPCTATDDSAQLVPASWAKKGWVPCQQLVSAAYDPSIACGKALKNGQECSLKDPHACGYGLICVAQSVKKAKCKRICSRKCVLSSCSFVLGGCARWLRAP